MVFTAVTQFDTCPELCKPVTAYYTFIGNSSTFCVRIIAALT